MISNSKIMEMGRKSLKGYRLRAAGITVIGNLIAIAIVFAIYFILVNFKEPNVISLENTIIDQLSGIAQSVIIYLFGIGFYAYFYDIYKQRTTSFRRLFAGFKKLPRNLIILFICSLVMNLLTSLPMSLYLLYSDPVETNPYPILTLGITMLVVLCIVGYKFFPTWMGLVYKMAIDDTTGPIELIKQTYRKVSKYNFKFLGFMVHITLWCMLGVLTLGIGFLWILPIIATSSIIFFDIIFNPDEYAVPKEPETNVIPENSAEITPPEQPKE